ncbi:MAG: hypothetical protein COA59_06740 [Colwellia sp.]|nr:MAG: hypothetical protein COA59_06740 [Colwellia sp.]
MSKEYHIMNISSLLPNILPAKVAQWLHFILLTLLTVYFVYFQDASPYFIIVVFVSAIFLYASEMKLGSETETLLKVKQAITVMQQGNLEVRVLNVPRNDINYGIAKSLNSALDQLEISMRESKFSYIATERAQFYRKPIEQGLSKGFLPELKNTTAAINTIEKSYFSDKTNELLNQLTTGKSESLLHGLSGTQKDLGFITTEMKTVENFSKASMDTALNNQTNVKTLHERLNVIVERSTAMRDNSQELAASSEEIKNMVSMIVGVADQTNLLALNAAIEAARAGEHGRGFAVVAEEVKNLAGTTKDAAKQIANIIERFANASQVMTEDTEHMATISEDSKELIDDFKVSFDKVAKDSQKTYQMVSNVQIICDTALIKVDHLIYMQRAYFAVEHNEPNGKEASMVAVNHHNCRFGKWYTAPEGVESYGHLPSYNAIDDPHSRVHNNVHQVMEIIHNDWEHSLDLQADILHIFGEAETASRELVALVDNLAEEKRTFESSKDKK